MHLPKSLSYGPQKADDLIVFLHGYGADKQDLAPLKSNFPGAAVECLGAPFSLGCGGDGMGRAWFALDWSAAGIDYKTADVLAASDLVAKKLQELRESRLNPGGKLYVFGFSQGAIIASMLFLRHPDLVYGIFGLATRFKQSLFPQMSKEQKLQFKDRPVFLAHGETDDVIPFKSGCQVRDYYKNLPVKLQWSTHYSGHTILPQTEKALRAFHKQN